MSPGLPKSPKATWTKRSEIGNPGLGDVTATSFDLFLANLSAELLHKAQPVRLAPFFHDLAAHDAEDFDP